MSYVCGVIYSLRHLNVKIFKTLFSQVFKPTQLTSTYQSLSHHLLSIKMCDKKGCKKNHHKRHHEKKHHEKKHCTDKCEEPEYNHTHPEELCLTGDSHCEDRISMVARVCFDCHGKKKYIVEKICPIEQRCHEYKHY